VFCADSRWNRARKCLQDKLPDKDDGNDDTMITVGQGRGWNDVQIW